jgi:hypothetical protein
MKNLGKMYNYINKQNFEKGKVFTLKVEHDEGCPSLKTHSMLDCKCNPDFSHKKISS